MDDYKPRPGTAAVLSFVFNGLGQLYNGQIFKGLVIIFFSALSMLILLVGAILLWFCLANKSVFAGQLALGLIMFSLGIIFICILGIYSITDAYKTAAEVQRKIG